MQKEVGPPLLTPLSEDAIVDTIIPWSAIQSSLVQPDFAVALVRSIEYLARSIRVREWQVRELWLVFDNDFPLSRRICDIYVVRQYINFPGILKKQDDQTGGGGYHCGSSRPGKGEIMAR